MIIKLNKIERKIYKNCVELSNVTGIEKQLILKNISKYKVVYENTNYRIINIFKYIMETDKLKPSQLNPSLLWDLSNSKFKPDENYIKSYYSTLNERDQISLISKIHLGLEKVLDIKLDSDTRIINAWLEPRNYILNISHKINITPDQCKKAYLELYDKLPIFFKYISLSKLNEACSNSGRGHYYGARINLYESPQIADIVIKRLEYSKSRALTKIEIENVLTYFSKAYKNPKYKKLYDVITNNVSEKYIVDFNL